MARSSYVYVVTKGSLIWPSCTVVAAFTVKRELRKWVAGQASPEQLAVFRLRDGRSDPAAQPMTLDEVLNG